jgi:CHAT domain-containing protein
MTELQSIRAALGAPAKALYLGDRAREARLRSMDLSHTNVLVLATHGLLAGEVRGATEPGLVLTPPAKASEKDDGYLSASEVSALRLDADWVILSACNTAAGDGSAGAPGLSGLARAFFYAGARNLLASHWPVRDDVAAQLTVRTISLLRTNPQMSRAQALQQAMREVRDDKSHDGPGDTWAHPNAWAPFVLIGDGAH